MIPKVTVRLWLFTYDGDLFCPGQRTGAKPVERVAALVVGNPYVLILLKACLLLDCFLVRSRYQCGSWEFR
jgi:hypothetical protein